MATAKKAAAKKATAKQATAKPVATKPVTAKPAVAKPPSVKTTKPGKLGATKDNGRASCCDGEDSIDWVCGTLASGKSRGTEIVLHLSSQGPDKTLRDFIGNNECLRLTVKLPSVEPLPSGAPDPARFKALETFLRAHWDNVRCIAAADDCKDQQPAERAKKRPRKR